MSDAALIKTYADSLLMQYVGKTKAYAHVKAYVTALMIADLAIAVRDGYDLETAIGVQLDVLGKYAGLSREITGFDTTIDYWGFLDYGETPPKTGIVGFHLYGDPIDATRTRRYVENDVTIYTMLDDQYRTMMTLKFYKNLSNGSLASVDDGLSAVFGTRYLVFDSGMKARFFFNTADELLVSIAKFSGLLAQVTGVGIEIHLVDDVTSLFGYAVYGKSVPSYTKGFGLYGVTPVGGMASYEHTF